MTNPSLDGDQLAWQKLDSMVFKIKEQTSLEGQETFIGVGMTVPSLGLGHGADSNLVIVHLRNRMVVVPLRCGFAFELDDFGIRIPHLPPVYCQDQFQDCQETGDLTKWAA